LNRITDKDKNDWKNFTEGKETLENKDTFKERVSNQINFKKIDLHGYHLEEANKIIHSFIVKSFEEGVRKLNIVTGKGNRSKNESDPYKSKDLAILKYSVPNYICNSSELMKKILKIDLESVNSPLKGSFDIFLKKNN
tara:strand:- start:563 stop:976 length:414 start_codon:yes stop_codon:yes gene_type:complete